MDGEIAKYRPGSPLQGPGIPECHVSHVTLTPNLKFMPQLQVVVRPVVFQCGAKHHSLSLANVHCDRRHFSEQAQLFHHVHMTSNADARPNGFHRIDMTPQIHGTACKVPSMSLIPSNCVYLILSSSDSATQKPLVPDGRNLGQH